MTLKIISGGQTGADQAGWRAAKVAGLETGGWMPKGWLTEDGPRPEFAGLYGAREHTSSDYVPRTRFNVRDSEATIIFDTTPGDRLEDKSRGTRAAMRFLLMYGRPSIVVVASLESMPNAERVAATVAWLRSIDPEVLNIAGNRESKSPGIGAWVEAYLSEVFRLLKGDHQR